MQELQKSDAGAVTSLWQIYLLCQIKKLENDLNCPYHDFYAKFRCSFFTTCVQLSASYSQVHYVLSLGIYGDLQTYTFLESL